MSRTTSKKKGGALAFVIGSFAAVGAAIFLSKKENRTKVTRVAKSTARKAKKTVRKVNTAVKKAKSTARKVSSQKRAPAKKRKVVTKTRSKRK